MTKNQPHIHCRVLHDVATMSLEELEDQYDIEIDPDDGTVWDKFEFKSFPDIHHWAEYINQIEREDENLVAGKIKIQKTRIEDY